jgi:hypothetical protein
MSDFDIAFAGFAALDEGELAAPWSFRGQQMDVRYALFRTLEDAQDAHVRAVSAAMPESRRILSLAQRAFGDLRGLLAGLPTELFDRAPREGDWPVREVLRHMWVIERRYAVQTLYAIERADADPIRIADDRLPTPASMDATGTLADVLTRLAAARAESHRRLGDVAAALMTRPTIWGRYSVDVRFRLHRFAAHVVEHTVQCEKALDALGWRATEGRRIARRLAALLGEIEGLGAADEAREIERVLAERYASTRG